MVDEFKVGDVEGLGFFLIEFYMFSKCFKVIIINKDNKRVKIK